MNHGIFKGPAIPGSREEDQPTDLNIGQALTRISDGVLDPVDNIASAEVREGLEKKAGALTGEMEQKHFDRAPEHIKRWAKEDPEDYKGEMRNRSGRLMGTLGSSAGTVAGTVAGHALKGKDTPGYLPELAGGAIGAVGGGLAGRAYGKRRGERIADQVIDRFGDDEIAEQMGAPITIDRTE